MVLSGNASEEHKVSLGPLKDKGVFRPWWGKVCQEDSPAGVKAGKGSQIMDLEPKHCERAEDPVRRKVIGSLGGHRSIVTLVQIGNDGDAHGRVTSRLFS